MQSDIQFILLASSPCGPCRKLFHDSNSRSIANWGQPDVRSWLIIERMKFLIEMSVIINIFVLALVKPICGTIVDFVFNWFSFFIIITSSLSGVEFWMTCMYVYLRKLEDWWPLWVVAEGAFCLKSAPAVWPMGCDVIHCKAFLAVNANNNNGV